MEINQQKQWGKKSQTLQWITGFLTELQEDKTDLKPTSMTSTVTKTAKCNKASAGRRRSKELCCFRLHTYRYVVSVCLLTYFNVCLLFSQQRSHTMFWKHYFCSLFWNSPRAALASSSHTQWIQTDLICCCVGVAPVIYAWKMKTFATGSKVLWTNLFQCIPWRAL